MTHRIEQAPKPRFAFHPLHNDVFYAAVLVVIWSLAEILFAYRTLPGGIGMLPMFVFMTLFNLGAIYWAWNNRDAF